MYASLNDARCIASKDRKAIRNRLEDPCPPGKHLACLECLCCRRVHTLRRHTKLSNHFTRSGQSKNNFGATLIKVRYLRTTVSEQKCFLYRIAPQKHRLLTHGVSRASHGYDIRTDRTGKISK